jgi:sigma-B regulation protein RsbU (phosphoserine phosphatase)
MAMIRAVVHTLPLSSFDPGSVLQYVNRHFEYLWDTPMFATGISAMVSEGCGTLTFTCAGHPVPLLSRRGRVRPLPVDATRMLLMFDLPEMPFNTTCLEPGDRLLLYTDGVTDRVGPREEMYDLDRLCSALARAGSADAQGTLDTIVGDLDAFAGGHEPHDDQTLLVVAFD